jgi:restriction system protein
MVISMVRSIRRLVDGSKAPAAVPPPLPSTVAVNSVQELDWEEFELLVGEIARRRGYKVEMPNAGGADGGIDLVLRKDGRRGLVQCKNWNKAKVTAKEIREFYGVLVSEGAFMGIFVTASEYTKDARDFAEGKPLQLVDGQGLAKLMNEVKTQPGEDLLDVTQWLPTFIQEVTIIDPLCPFCRSAMTLRRGSFGSFWGCSTYPRCKGKREVRKHLPVVSF